MGLFGFSFFLLSAVCDWGASQRDIHLLFFSTSSFVLVASFWSSSSALPALLLSFSRATH